MVDASAQTFEEIYRELEDAVRRLEAGDLSLEASLELFERGATLAEQCHASLDRAELRVRQLVAQDDGTLHAEPFDLGQNNV